MQLTSHRDTYRKRQPSYTGNTKADHSHTGRQPHTGKSKANHSQKTAITHREEQSKSVTADTAITQGTAQQITHRRHSHHTGNSKANHSLKTQPPHTENNIANQSHTTRHSHEPPHTEYEDKHIKHDVHFPEGGWDEGWVIQLEGDGPGEVEGGR